MIPLPVAIVCIIYLGIIDTISIFLVLLGLDDFFILDIAALPVSIYLIFIGVPIYRFAGFIGEFIPYLGVLPLYTINFIFVVITQKIVGEKAFAPFTKSRGLSSITKRK